MDQEQSINKRVSIVIPVYNSHKTLPKCLDSMIAQTYKDLEIICVNDCSKDNSLEIIQEYQKKDPRVKLVNHTENMNAGGARNSGIKYATGTYVCLVDNDDWLERNAIDILVQNSDDFSCDLVLTDLYLTFQNGNKKVIKNIPANLDIHEKIIYGLLNGTPLLGSLIKKELFVDNNLFYPEKIFYEDNPVHFSLLTCSKKINVVESPLYYYYQADGSVTRSTNKKKILDRIHTTDLLLDNVNRIGTYQTYKKYINIAYLQLLCNTLNLLAKISLIEAFSVLKELVKRMQSVDIDDDLDLNSKYQFSYKHPFISYFIKYIKFNLMKCI